MLFFYTCYILHDTLSDPSAATKHIIFITLFIHNIFVPLSIVILSAYNGTEMVAKQYSSTLIILFSASLIALPVYFSTYLKTLDYELHEAINKGYRYYENQY